MDFFGLGPIELAIILLVAFAVLGPKEMVNAARKVGRFVRQVNKVSSEVTKTLSEEVPEVKSAVQDFRKAGSDIQQSLNDATQPARDAAKAAGLNPAQSVPIPDNAAKTTPPTVITPTSPPGAGAASADVSRDTVEGKPH